MRGLEDLCFFNEQRMHSVKKTFTKQRYNDEYCLIKI